MENSGFLNQAFTNLKKFVEQQPKAVAQLFNKHYINAEPTHRNVANAMKVKPDFAQSLLKLATQFGNSKGKTLTGDSDNFTGDYVNLTGDDRFTLADKLANAGLVFSNIIRDTQHKPENYNQIVPSYYEPSGKFNVHTATEGTHVLGMDKKLLLIAGAVLIAIVVFQLHKK